MIVPKIETTDPCEEVSSQNVYTEQTSDSIHIGGYCSTNYEQQKSTISLDSLSYLVRDDLQNEEALDLTQNQKSTLNSKESDFANNCLSTNKISDKRFNSPTQDFSNTLQMTETLNNHGNLYSQKYSNSFSLFKEAVKLSEDGMQVFVIVSRDKNSFSYWGTKNFSDKFTSSQPLTKFDRFTCYNVFENFTTNTSVQVNNNNSYDRINPLPSLPTALRAGHLKIPSLYSLKKRSSLSFLSSSPKKKKRQSEPESNNHLQENKVRKSKSKSSKSEPYPQNCEKTSISTHKKDITDVNQEIPTNKKGKNKNDKCESNVAKEGTGSSLLQRERSQALLRILMSRKKNLMKNETNESLNQQKMEGINCNRKSNSNRYSSGLSKSSPATKLNLRGSNLENDKTQDSRNTLLELTHNKDTEKGLKNVDGQNKAQISIPEELLLNKEKKNKNKKKFYTKTEHAQIS